MCEEQQKEKHGKWRWKALVILCVCVLMGIGAAVMGRSSQPKGCLDYTVQMEQYYVEYSDEYDYWDVLTVEYPWLQEADTEFREQINAVLYDMAMERVYYWHLSPDE